MCSCQYNHCCKGRYLLSKSACKSPKDVFGLCGQRFHSRRHNKDGEIKMAHEVNFQRWFLGSKCSCIEKKIKDLWSTFAIHSTHIKQNCSIFGFTCPLKENFLRPRNTSSTFLKFELSRRGRPMLKTWKNTVRNQFEQQWFHVISFQKPRRVYTAIWYKLMPFAIKKRKFKLSTPAKCTSHVKLGNLRWRR